MQSIDRVTQLRVHGLRTIDRMSLDLKGLTVLIGENGTGKSSILEAMELLRQAAKPCAYVTDVITKAHGGLPLLLRRGSDELRLGVTIEGAGPRLDYDFTVGTTGKTPSILHERLQISGAASRDGASGARLLYAADRLNTQLPADGNSLALPCSGLQAHPAIQRALDALARIEVHAPFVTRPLWQQRELGLRAGPRWPSQIEPAGSLSRYALNLPNAFHQLRNMGDDVWSRVIDRARLGLGEDLRNFRLPASGRGNIELELVFGSSPDLPLPAEGLSEGQLSYLAFLALIELSAGRSVLGMDAPELHLHPALLSRVVLMLEEMSESTPVILATHSDCLLNALSDPARSIALCVLDRQKSTKLLRPSKDRLEKWLERYKGVGSIRADGYEAHVFLDAQEHHESKSEIK